MLASGIKLFSIILSGIYLFVKLLHLTISKKKLCFCIIYTSLLSLVLAILKTSNNYFTHLLVFAFLLGLFLTAFHETFTVTFKTTIIVHGISIIMSIIPSVICGCLLFLHSHFISTTLPNEALTYTVFSIIQLCVITLPFRLGRLKKGMPFLYEKKNTLGILVCIAAILLVTLVSPKMRIKEFVKLSLLPIVVLFLLAIIIWWRYRIKSRYLNQLQIRNMSLLKDECNKKNEELILLNEQNKDLSKIIHKDNKLIPAMMLSVERLLSLAPNSTQSQLETDSNILLSELKKLSEERLGILRDYDRKTLLLPLTGNTAVDSLMSFFYQRAIKAGIEFSVILSEDNLLKDKNGQIYDDLPTLLADLAENAFIATSLTKQKNVLVRISLNNDILCLEMSDSGVSFPPDVVKSFGYQRKTTHENDGGSGIGLMTVFEILKKNNASYCMEDYEISRKYTKKISIHFDNNNYFIISSTRPEMLAVSKFRQDFIFHKPDQSAFSDD